MPFSTNPGGKKLTGRSAVLNKDENILNRIERTEFEFLVSDVELAMTLVRIAAQSNKDAEKKARNQQNARHAYDTVVRLSTSIALTDNERAELNEKLHQLKSALEEIGEVF